MKSYYYMDCLHREIFLEEEDIQAVPESGRADEACSAIAGSAAPQAKAAASSSAVICFNNPFYPFPFSASKCFFLH